MNRHSTTDAPKPSQPIESPQVSATQQASSLAPSLVSSPISANYRRTDLLALKFYPPLLLLATATAAAFCFLYLTKPTTIQVHPTGTDLLPGPKSTGTDLLSSSKSAGTDLLPGPKSTGTDLLSSPKSTGTDPETAVQQASLLPAADHLPGDVPTLEQPTIAASAPSQTTSTVGSASGVTAPNLPSPFVPTPFTIHQPVMLHPPVVESSVTTTVEFPAFFRAGTLRWTPALRIRAETILVRLKTHQQECLRLRMESAELLDAWNEILRDSSPPIQPEPEPVQR